MSGHGPPVDRLLAAAADGDQGAWAQLVTRYTPLVVTVTSLTRVLASASPVAQVQIRVSPEARL